MKKAAAILLGASLASSAAIAVEQWSGSYSAINLGFGFNPGDNGELEFERADGSDNSAAINNAFGENFEGKFNSGALLGFELGSDYQSGNWVYGAALDISMADISQEQSAFSATPATYIERRELDFVSTISGRLGWASDLPVLPYVRAGLAYGDVSYSWEGNSGAFRGDNGDDGDGLGYMVGFGAEFKLDKQLSLAVEYRYLNLGDADFETYFSGENDMLGQPTGASAAFGTSAQGGSIAQGTDEDFDFQSVSVQLRYRF